MRLAAFLLCCSLISALAAQPAREAGIPPLRSYTPQDYLAHGQVWRVQQLPDRRMLFANAPGLLLYDGARFESLAFEGGLIYDFALAPDGRILLGHAQGLGYFERDASAHWQARRHTPPAELSGHGDIARVAHHEGLDVYLARNLLLAVDGAGQWWSQASERGYADLALRDGELWIFEEGQGWLRFEPGRRQLLALAEAGAPTDTVVAQSDEPGEPWYVANRNTLFRRDAGLWTALDWPGLPRILSERIETLARLPDGSVAIGTRFGGLYQYSATGELKRHLATALFPGERITDIEMDAEGGLWLSLDGGIVRVEADSRYTRFDRELGAGQIERIRRIDGHLLVASRLGMKRLEPDPRPGMPARLQPYGILRNSAWDFAPTAAGLLVATGSGIELLSPTGEPLRSVYSGPRVSAFAEGGDGYWYFLSGRELRRLRATAAAIEVDPEAVVQVPMFDLHRHQDALWASIDGGGVFEFSGLEQWPAINIKRFGSEQGIPPGRVTFAEFEGELRLMVDGVRQRAGDGFVLDPRFPAGFATTTLAPLGEDWIGSADLLAVLKPDASGQLSIDSTPLVRYREPNRHLHVDPDGTRWLADNTLFARVSDWPQPLLPAPPLQMVGIRDGSGHSLRGSAAVDAPTRLELAATQRSIEVELAWPSWQSERPIRWQQRLAEREEFEDLPGPDARLDLDSAGLHRVEFRAIDGHQRSSQTLTLTLTIAPYWYESLWTRIAVLLAVLGGIVLIARGYAGHRVRRLEAERQRLEAVVAARTADIRRQASEIQRLAEARTRFFANVSHEFRTPLSLILGPLRDVLDGRFGALAGGLSGAVRTAHDSAQRLLRMVGELLDLSRLEAGRFELHVGEYDLAEQLRRACERFQALARSKDIALSWQGLADPLLFYYDPDQLDRMIDNLLGNALKFTPAGGRVSLRLVPTAKEVGIEVEDNGPGIAADDRAHIFERFYQGAQQARPDAPGTGIGLALVKELTELHGGRVELVDGDGPGACFAIWLRRGHAHFRAADLQEASPVTTSSATPLPVLGSVEDEAPQAAAEARPTLLVVDDHAELRRYLSDRLRDAYNVISARNGEEALALIAERLPDAVISDVMMPGLDGLSLARELRRNPETQGVPLILLSAKAHKRDVVAGLDAGADDYLSKPFDTSELIARIETQFELRRRLRVQLRSEQASQLDARPDPAASPQQAAAEAVDDGFESAQDRFRQRLSQVLAERMDDASFGVAELADALHMDRATLFRRFKQLYAQSPSEWLRDARLERAALLLRTRRGSVSEIAYATGFENLSHFSQTFRKRYGLSPSGYAAEGGEVGGR